MPWRSSCHSSARFRPCAQAFGWWMDRAWPRLAVMKIRDVLRLLRRDGWRISRIRGSHRQLKHAVKPGLVTVAGSGNDDLSRGTLNSILKQAGLKSGRQE